MHNQTVPAWFAGVLMAILVNMVIFGYRHISSLNRQLAQERQRVQTARSETSTALGVAQENQALCAGALEIIQRYRSALESERSVPVTTMLAQMEAERETVAILRELRRIAEAERRRAEGPGGLVLPYLP